MKSIAQSLARSVFAIVFACAVCATAAAQQPPAAAAAPSRVIERSIEASGLNVVLPSQGTSQFVVKRCSTCAPTALLATPRTIYMQGDKVISLMDLRINLGRTPDMDIAVFYDPKTLELRRVLTSGGR